MATASMEPNTFAAEKELLIQETIQKVQAQIATAGSQAASAWDGMGAGDYTSRGAEGPACHSGSRAGSRGSSPRGAPNGRDPPRAADSSAHRGDMQQTSELMRQVADALGVLRGSTQESADAALKQAGAVASMNELLGRLYRAIEDCVKTMKDAKVEKEEMASLVNDLSSDMAAERQRSEDLERSKAELQSHMQELEDKLQQRSELLQSAHEQMEELIEKHERGTKDAQQLRAVHLEVESQVDDLAQQLEDERAQKQALKVAKQQLQSQLKHMVKAEKDLTKGLREAHEQIELQLQQLRDEVAQERAAKEGLKAKKNTLAANLKDLSAKSKADQQLIEQLQAELQAAKQAHSKTAAELKAERKVARASAQGEKVYQEKCNELEAQLAALRTHSIYGGSAPRASGARKANSAVKKKAIADAKGPKRRDAQSKHRASHDDDSNTSGNEVDGFYGML